VSFTVVVPRGNHVDSFQQRQAHLRGQYQAGVIRADFNSGFIGCIMKLPRRQFLHLAAGAAALPVISRAARAQAYPSRPARIIVPLAAGSTNDIAARSMGQWLADRLSQPFIVENRPGAGGNIATEAVVRAPADGYTLFSAGSASAINATLYENLKFVFLRDIAPVAGFMRVPNIMVVHPSFPAMTVSEFIAYAKANPGKVNFASPGAGTSTHMAGELFKMMAGVDMIHVPNRMSALSDLLAGHVQIMFDGLPTSIEQIKANKLRALAVTTAKRSEVLPDIPTVGDYVPGYEASTWFGLGAPKNTPAEIVGKLNSEINVALNDPKMRARLADLGGTVLPGSPSDFGKLIAEDTEKWGKVIRTANIKAE
jgi:tripartite-type tricarboxylate transporter receptor subunit TctC